MLSLPLLPANQKLTSCLVLQPQQWSAVGTGHLQVRTSNYPLATQIFLPDDLLLIWTMFTIIGALVNAYATSNSGYGTTSQMEVYRAGPKHRKRKYCPSNAV
jgi:hypothetical protein